MLQSASFGMPRVAQSSGCACCENLLVLGVRGACM